MGSLNHRPLLSEILRPQSLAELNLPDDQLVFLQRCISAASVPNMLFYGEPGIGKTSAARILIHGMNAEVLELNGSFNDGDKAFVRRIEGFSTTVPFSGRPKICFIDEADYMPKPVQDSLRYLIEKVSDNARFILTANDESKLTSAMRSRCMPICFNVTRKDIESVKERMVIRYKGKLRDAGYEIQDQRLEELVNLFFPDLRSIANNLEMNAQFEMEK